MKNQLPAEKKSDLGEEPLVDWEVGFGMRKSELRTPRRRPGCCGRVAPIIVFRDFLFEELKNFGCTVWNWMLMKE